MDDDQNRTGGAADDDAYIIEDTGESVEELEREMEATAAEAVAATDEREEEPKRSGGDSAEWRERYLRTLADFENYRKRADREKQEFYKYAMQGVLKDLLPVLDNFDRALDHAEEGDEFHKGVSLIYKQLFEVLTKHGLKTIEESGVHFDPNIHEAVVREEDSSVPSHTVTAVLQKGYFLHDRLLRPAMVKVAVGGPEHA
jgi:molecular chaperone GrpE